MVSDKEADGHDIAAACHYVRPARPLIYLWMLGVGAFIVFLEVHAYNSATFFQFLLSVPVFVFLVFVFTAGFLGAARLEINERFVRRSLLGRDIQRIPWEDAKVIQGLYLPRQGGRGGPGYRVLSKKKFLFFGNIFFADEGDALSTMLNAIAERFRIPLEQRPTLYAKFERVDAIRFE